MNKRTRVISNPNTKFRYIFFYFSLSVLYHFGPAQLFIKSRYKYPVCSVELHRFSRSKSLVIDFEKRLTPRKYPGVYVYVEIGLKNENRDFKKPRQYLVSTCLHPNRCHPYVCPSIRISQFQQ